MFDLLIYMFENYLSSKNNLDFANMTLELEAAGFNNKDIEKPKKIEINIEANILSDDNIRKN